VLVALVGIGKAVLQPQQMVIHQLLELCNQQRVVALVGARALVQMEAQVVAAELQAAQTLRVEVELLGKVTAVVALVKVLVTTTVVVVVAKGLLVQMQALLRLLVATAGLGLRGTDLLWLVAVAVARALMLGLLLGLVELELLVEALVQWLAGPETVRQLLPMQLTAQQTLAVAVAVVVMLVVVVAQVVLV